MNRSWYRISEYLDNGDVLSFRATCKRFWKLTEVTNITCVADKHILGKKFICARGGDISGLEIVSVPLIIFYRNNRNKFYFGKRILINHYDGAIVFRYMKIKGGYHLVSGQTKIRMKRWDSYYIGKIIRMELRRRGINITDTLN